MPGPGFVTGDQWKNSPGCLGSSGGEIMSQDSETNSSAAAEAAAEAVAAPLDLLLTDAAIGSLRRLNPGGSGLRLSLDARRIHDPDCDRSSHRRDS